MTVLEFSDQFDTLLVSHRLKYDFGNIEGLERVRLDEYEKSVYLTNAQNDILLELYTGSTPSGNSFEQTEEARRYLSDLVKTSVIDNISEITSGVADKSYIATLPEDLLWITYESTKVIRKGRCSGEKWIKTVPIKRDEYHEVKDDPFKNPYVFRVDHNENKVELIHKDTIEEYKVSYISAPSPIILEDITPLSIMGVGVTTECALNPMLHQYILEKAVQSALQDIARMVPSSNN